MRNVYLDKPTKVCYNDHTTHIIDLSSSNLDSRPTNKSPNFPVREINHQNNPVNPGNFPYGKSKEKRPNPMKLHQFLTNRRIELGYSQPELSKIANMPQTTLSAIETGKAHPTLKSIAKLSYYLYIPPEDILRHPDIFKEPPISDTPPQPRTSRWLHKKPYTESPGPGIL